MIITTLVARTLNLRTTCIYAVYKIDNNKFYGLKLPQLPFYCHGGRFREWAEVLCVTSFDLPVLDGILKRF